MVASHRQGWSTVFLGVVGAPALSRALGFDRVRRTKKHPVPDEKFVWGGAARRDFWRRRPQTAFGGPLGGRVEMLDTSKTYLLS
jgi:hypothetical protein